MTTTVRTQMADHLSAITDLAKTVGMKLVYQESGYAVFADKVFAETSLNGGPDDVDGVGVEISFDEHGEVSSALKLVNGVPKGRITDGHGNAGQRLLWALHLFSSR